MTWNPLTEPVNHVILAGQRSPGIAELQGFSSPRRWDERRGYALSGATLVFRGVGLAHGKLLLRLYTPQDWDDWSTFSTLVQRPPLGERARAMDISHPILEALGVRSVVVEDVKQPTETGTGGEYTIEISLIEHRRLQITPARTEGSEDQPTDPVDRTIGNLEAIVQNGGEGDVLQALAGLDG